MSAQIISFAQARECADAHKGLEQNDFQDLFRIASNFRLATPECTEGDINIVNWAGLKDSFQKGIADEVFAQKLFDRSVLISIAFVSELLTSYAKGEITRIGIAEYLGEYEDNRDPNCLLQAANSAFIFFALSSQTRPRSALKYQAHGIKFGPSLYAQYGEVTKKAFGTQMAEAFQPLGEIVREHYGFK